MAVVACTQQASDAPLACCIMLQNHPLAVMQGMMLVGMLLPVQQPMQQRQILRLPCPA